MYEMLDMGGSSNVIYSVNQFIGNACKCLLLPSTKNASQSFFWSFNESGFIDILDRSAPEIVTGAPLNKIFTSPQKILFLWIYLIWIFHADGTT